MNRPDLDVITDAHALRLLFEGRRAVGVEYEWFGSVRQARADVEVIVAAGAYASPQLLMLSGIGPAEDLELMVIDVLEGLPVGHNLLDHCTPALTFFTDGGTLARIVHEACGVEWVALVVV